MDVYEIYDTKDGGIMPELGERQTIQGRYWNCNDKGITIVAVITHGIDWAAYIGADDGWSEVACIRWAADMGVKLSAQDAKHFFPDIKLPYRG